MGIWTDRKLQTLAKQQVSYFRNSFDLRQELCSTQYHPSAQLFTAEAISMYTNIPTNTAIMLIARHIRTSIKEIRPKQNKALIDALKLVMLNNYFVFGDMTFKQTNGTAMGTPPQRHHTLRSTLDYTRRSSSHNIVIMWFSTNVSLMTCSESCSHIPTKISTKIITYPGLTWEFHEPTDKVDFMGLTISITKGQISTSLYETPLNLHLYIYHRTLPTHQGSYQASCTVPYSGFTRYALTTKISSRVQKSFSKDL